jgi:hypothetical protein
MITEFKLFENSNNVDFKVGDYVYAIDIKDSNNELQHDVRYKITKIYTMVYRKPLSRSTNPIDMCDIKGKYDEEKYEFFLSRFISEEEYENVKKYNL